MNLKIQYLDAFQQKVDPLVPKHASRITSGILVDQYGSVLVRSKTYWSEWSRSYAAFNPAELLTAKAKNLLFEKITQCWPGSIIRTALDAGPRGYSSSRIGRYNQPPTAAGGRYIRKWLEIALNEVRCQMRAEGDFPPCFDISGYSLRIRGRCPNHKSINTSPATQQAFKNAYDLSLSLADQFDVYLRPNTRGHYQNVI